MSNYLYSIVSKYHSWQKLYLKHNGAVDNDRECHNEVVAIESIEGKGDSIAEELTGADKFAGREDDKFGYHEKIAIDDQDRVTQSQKEYS